MRLLSALLTMLQIILASRVLVRLVRTAGGVQIREAPTVPGSDEKVSVLVPVLDEENRLEPCLAGLMAQGDVVAEIIVIDGGSTDGTGGLVRRYSERDRRIRLIEAGQAPPGVNGKAWQLQVGLEASTPGNGWVLTIDADVRPTASLVPSLLAHACAHGVPVLSVATRQELAGFAEAIVHPAMLTTLVYRFGIPGSATRNPERVQANGQCFLVRRHALLEVGGFASVTDSVCEDVTLARALADAGHAVGFYEAGELVSVDMYPDALETWRNWSRSLPMRDRYTHWSSLGGLAEVLLVQALPLPCGIATLRSPSRHNLSGYINGLLVLVRLGILVGTARAYRSRPPTYWFSPLADMPVALKLFASSVRRRHVWRGRAVVSRGHP
jgi:dolichol-phosphate mannosyltransferase